MSGDLAGRLRAKVALSRREEVRDALGAPTSAWIENGTAWASVEREGYGPPVAGDARAEVPLWRVTLRPCDIRVGDLIEWAFGAIVVRTLDANPALPDRIVARGEDHR